ncbi:MAG: hypothetical protein LAO03_20275 [Acidobacteriia bacterium]|nr:hypothetical protein [Terriglobia bacterium]
MTINSLSTSNLHNHLNQLRQTDLKQLAGDISIRNDHIAQMQKDMESGDVAGATQEKAAALDAQKNVLADRAQLTDLRNNVHELRADFVERSQDLKDLRTAIRNNDKSAAKQAFEALGKIQTEIRGDVKQIRDGGPVPTPINLNV